MAHFLATFSPVLHPADFARRTPKTRSADTTCFVGVKLRVALRPDGSVPFVEWAGEFQDFAVPEPLVFEAIDEAGFAVFRAEGELETGVYAHKLRVDGAWTLGEGVVRTRSVDGLRNALLVVGGAPEPLVFAPALPFVHEADGGGVVVEAALRRGFGDSLTILFAEAEGEPFRRLPMPRVRDEDEHVVFRVRAPFSASRTRYLFELESGMTIGHDPMAEGRAAEEAVRPFVHTREAPSTPPWWREAIVYTIFVDRFRPSRADGPDGPRWGDDPGPDRPAGGDLEGIRRSLPYLAELGVTCLHLTPVHPGASCHRYDVDDPFVVDDLLGGEDALRALLDEAHRLGLRVLLDFSILHVGPRFLAWERLRAEGPSSPWARWFRWSRKDPPELLHYGSRSDAPLLDLHEPEVRRFVLEAAERWAHLPIDGFRLDAAADVPTALAREIRRVLRKHRPDAVVVGEVVPEHGWRFRQAGAVDAATDFSTFHALRAFVGDGSADAAMTLAKLARAQERAAGPGPTALRFVSTHDHARLATLTVAAGKKERTALGHLLLLALPGVPALVYGEELGLAAPVVGLVPEGGAWPDRMPMPWSPSAEQIRYRAFLTSALRARRGSEALVSGELELLFGEGSVLVLRRRAGREVVDVVVNVGDAEVEVDLVDEERPRLLPLVVAGQVSTSGCTVRLGPRAGAWLRRVDPDGAPDGGERARRLPLVTAARDDAFRRADLAGAPAPTRFDFALTDVCNLRCRHCITLAPERTRSGSARTLPRHLLNALEPHLAKASYFGFVHGGETLAAAPLFFDLLARIRGVRAGAPYDVHLLTNGMLLTGETTARLVEHGVTSLFVSLDGATARTNDAIREGAKLDVVCENVRAAVALRRAVGANLRIGLSYVIASPNEDEIVPFVELAASLGVDWVKLEELVPVTAFAKRSLVAPDAPHIRERVRAAVELGRALGVVVVDHTRDRTLYRCELDADAAAFVAADEFANRTTLHPCRAPWEHVCIDASGDVRLVDFFGPVLGNLTTNDLGELFAGAVARSERQRTLVTRPCRTGPVTCL